MFFRTRPTDEVLCVQTLLEALKREEPVTAIEDVMLGHPSHPSLLSISRALDALGIAHDALRADAEHLDELTRPLIAHLKAGSFAVVLEVTGTDIVLSHVPGRSRRMSRAEFIEQWSGAVLVPTGASERSHARARPAEVPTAVLAAALVALGGVACGLSFVDGVPSWTWAAILVAKLMGLFLSSLLVGEEFGLRTPAQGLCRLSGRTSCASVLQSPAGKIGPISMADIGLGYFGGGLLAALLAPSVVSGFDATLAGLRVLNLAALPYTVFSITYQAFVVRRWCPLCVAVQALLWAEAVALTTVPLAAPAGLAAGACMPLAIMPLPWLVWLAAKPRVRGALALRPTEFALKRLQNTPAVIMALLQSQRPEQLPPTGLVLHLGPSDAKLTVTVYAAPDCPHCKNAHGALRAVMAAVPGVVRVVVRLQLPLGPSPDAGRLVNGVAELLAASRNDEAADLLEGWYAGAADKTKLLDAAQLGEPARQLITRLVEEKKEPPFRGVPVVFVGDRRWPTELPFASLEYLAATLSDSDD